MARCATMETPMETRVEPPKAILRRVAALYGVSLDDLVGSSRRPWLVKARRAAALAMLAEGMSVTEAGRFLGKHYTSILYYLGRAKAKAS